MIFVAENFVPDNIYFTHNAPYRKLAVKLVRYKHLYYSAIGTNRCVFCYNIDLVERIINNRDVFEQLENETTKP